MSTHTPGPWHIGMKPGPTVYGPQGEQITWSANPLLDEQEHRANQRLIAAAPDLLATLKLAQFAIEGLRDIAKAHAPGCFLPDVSVAIAKAEGRG